MTRDVFINGAWAPGAGAAFQKNNPANGKLSWEGRAADPVQVSGAVSAARAAFSAWAIRPQDERTAILNAYADELAKRADAIATAISEDMGKASWEAAGEAKAMQAKVAISIAALDERTGTHQGKAAFGETALTHRPHGVMAVLGPFNFPGHLPNGHIVPALLAGNTCVFKPSELAPSVAGLMVDAFEAAGLPAGVLNVVQGGKDTGAALLEADINGLLFTGSAGAGTYFHKLFGGRPEVILALEMGGNNPLILWDPADIDSAADIAAQSAFFTTGQRCSCARRAILPEGAWGDQVVAAIVERAKALKIGSADTPDIFMGPLVDEKAGQNALDFQMMLSKSGGKSLRRLKRMKDGDAFVTAGVIDVTDAGNIPDEELFGPLLQIIRVPDFGRALEVANATKYGLSAGLVCDDDDLWNRAYVHMKAGILNRNRPTAGASSALPFGGPGLSGNSRPGAYYAADYCAWPQASQIASKAERMTASGFPK